MLWLDDGSTQHIYQGIQKYVVVGLMNHYWSNKVVSLSFSEAKSVIFPSGKKSFQIIHFSLTGNFWPY